MARVRITALPATLADGRTVLEPYPSQRFVVWRDYTDWGRDQAGRRNIGDVIDDGFVATFEEALAAAAKHLKENPDV